MNKSDPASSRFAHHRGDTDDPWRPGDYRVLALHEDQHGVLWIGTDGGGIDALDRETGEWHHYRHDPADPGSLGTGSVHAIHEDASGTLWVGTDDGFYRFDRQAGRFDRLPHHPPDPGDVKQETVYSIDEDGQGILWLGTQGRGLSEFDPATGTFIYHQHGWDPDTGLPERHTLSSNFVRDVFEDASGRLWVGTTDGLSVFDRDAGQWHSLDHNPDEPGSLSHDWVMSLYGDQSGMLWVGTQGGGLNRLVLSQVKGSDPATCTFTHYREQDGLANDTVWDILEQDGHLWIATANGLSRFDPRTETFRSYDAGDALPINEFSAACASSSGELLFGGINGFISFYPAQMEPNPYTPPVVLTSLQQNGKEVNADRAPEDLTEVTFRWPDNTFEFGFAALNYTQPGKNQHAYMLEGFDEDWNHIGARRFGRYTNLPGGKYTLRLKGSNNDGVWNEEGASIQVAIVPPFWSTWWFRAIAALVLLAGVAAGYGLRVRSLQARSRDLEKQVMNRTKELAALNAIAATVSRSLDLDEVLNGALDKTLHVMEIEAGGIYLLDEEAGVLTVAAERGFSPEFVAGIDRLKVGEGFSGRVAQSGQPLLVRNISTDPRLTRMVVRHAGLRSAAIVPLSSKGKVLGTMFAITRGYREFTDQDIQLLTSIGDQIGVAVENARLYEQAQQVAVVEERQRLARELHDSVTQALYGVTLYSEAAAGHLALGHTDRTAEHLQELQDTAQEALAEMRLLVFELRPPILEELGLAAALQARLQAVEGRAGLRTEFKTNVDQRLPPDVEEGLYRIALEALNNALKHAQARNIKVHLRQEEPGRTPPARVTLEIADDGVGFDPATARERGGMGLSAMEERAAALGARLEVESRIGSGTTVTLTWEEDEGRATDDERQRLTEEDRRTDDALQV